MTKLYRRLQAVTLGLALLVASCGGDVIRSFRAALAASGPLVESLVAAGAINQESAGAIRKDFDDGALCADTLQIAFKAVPANDPNAKSKKLSASVAGLKCFRVIIQRRNFEKDPRVKRAADIAEGILASLVVFYSEPGDRRADSRGAATAVDEADLKKKLEVQLEELKRAMKLRCRNEATGRFEQMSFCRENPITSTVETY